MLPTQKKMEYLRVRVLVVSLLSCCQPIYSVATVCLCVLKVTHARSSLRIKRNYIGRQGWSTPNNNNKSRVEKGFSRTLAKYFPSFCLHAMVVVVVIVIVAAVFGKHVCYVWDVIVAMLLVHYAMRIDWMIWKIADPHTTKMNSANSQGPTGYFSSAVLFVLGTLPRWVMLRLAFSLAMRILCCGAIVCCVWLLVVV